ncbi:MAG TPA: hypothetical protein VG497_04845 [Kribbella sp.]|nr:hypothetical protein [Kribbella sp.]
MHQSRGFRAARAAMFAVTCVLLAALGHVLMSGMMLPWWALPMAFGWIGVTAWIVADRERGVPFVVLSTLFAQGALHLVFSLAQTMTPMGHMHMSSSSGMVGAHLLAALLCGLWLAYGERAAFSVLRSLAVRVLLPLRLIAGAHVTPHRPGVTPAHSPTPLRELLLVHAITSRGPPRGVAV